MAVAGDRSFPTLEDWHAASGLDAGSLAVQPGYEDAEQEDFALKTGSPLIGRGRLAATIGPYSWHTVRRPLPIEHFSVQAIGESAVTFQWNTSVSSRRGIGFWQDLRTDSDGTTIEWGETSECKNKLQAPASAATYHTIGLTGLQPGKRYFFRITSPAKASELHFVPHLVKREKREPAAFRSETAVFTTLARNTPGRVFHVAVTGDDKNNGLSIEQAWRTINHAAGQVRGGDTVMIHAGVYKEFILIRAGGASMA